MGYFKNIVINLDYQLRGKKQRERYSFYYQMYLANCSEREKWGLKPYESLTDYIDANLPFLKLKYKQSGGVMEETFYHF